MEYSRSEKMEGKNRKAAWLDINFGCCASKEDVDVDEGRDALRAAGMYYFTTSLAFSFIFTLLLSLPIFLLLSILNIHNLTDVLAGSWYSLTLSLIWLIHHSINPYTQHPPNLPEPLNVVI